MSAKGIRAGRAYVELGTDDAKLVAGLRAAQKKLQSFGVGLLKVGAGIGAAGGAITGAMTGALAHFSESGDELTKMSNKTGASVESLSELRHAASQSAVEFDTLGKAIARQQKVLVDAKNGSKSAVEAFGRLGLNVEELSSLTPDQQFEAIAQKISELQDPAERTAAAMAIFGKSGADLMPLMLGGASAIQALRQEAQALGLTVSTADANAATLFGDTWANAMDVLKQALFTLGAAIAPVVTDIIAAVTPLLTMGVQWIAQNKQLVMIVAAVGAALAIAGALIVALGTGFIAVSSAVGVFTGLIGGAITILGAVLSPIGLVVGALIGGVAAWLYFSGAGGKAVGFVSDILGKLWQWVSTVFQGVFDAIAAGNWELAGQIMWKALQVAWKTGIGWVMTTWSQFKNDMISGFDVIITEIRSAWNKASTWIADKILWIVRQANSLIEKLTGVQLIADEVLADIQANVQQDSAALETGLREEQKKRIAARVKEIAETKRLTDAEIAKANADLGSLVQKAADERKAADAKREEERKKQEAGLAQGLDLEDIDIPTPSDIEIPEVEIPRVEIPEAPTLETPNVDSIDFDAAKFGDIDIPDFEMPDTEAIGANVDRGEQAASFGSFAAAATQFLGDAAPNEVEKEQLTVQKDTLRAVKLLTKLNFGITLK